MQQIRIIKFDPYREHDGQTYRKTPCPKCGQRIMLIPPETAWCENENCNYAQCLPIGDGIIPEYRERRKEIEAEKLKS